MKLSTYRRIPGHVLIGMRVQSVQELGNSIGKLEAGTYFTIVGKRAGLDLESDPCGTCGICLRVTRVPPGAVGDAYEVE